MKFIDRLRCHYIENRIANGIERQCVIKRDLKKKYQSIINTFPHESYEKEFSNKVFICWFQDLKNAPILVQKCVDSMKKAMPNREIIILNDDNYKDYIEFPDYIIKKYEDGIISKAHFSDLLRIGLLIEYGGLWVDSTVLCTATEEPTYITEEPLFVYKDISLNREDQLPIKASNWLINSCKNHPILLGTQKLLYEYWKTENEVSDYFIFHLCFSIACDEYKEDFENIPVFNNISPHILQFELEKEYTDARFEQIKRMSDFHKLNRRIEVESDIFTNYDFIVGSVDDEKN